MDAKKTLHQMEKANVETEKATKQKELSDHLERDAARATVEKVPM